MPLDVAVKALEPDLALSRPRLVQTRRVDDLDPHKVVQVLFRRLFFLAGHLLQWRLLMVRRKVGH